MIQHVIIALVLAVSGLGSWVYFERQSRITAVAKAQALEAVVKGQQRSLKAEKGATERQRQRAHAATIEQHRAARALEEALAGAAQSWGETPVPESVREALK